MIDLRSDTVTKPSPAMREAMLTAEVGDDVYGEDPAVNALEAYAAELTGKEAALYGVSGTQTNLLGILSHCQRGHEYIVGSSAHTYQYEAGGAAVLGGIQPCPIPFDSAGQLPLDLVAQAIKPDDYHFAISRLVCLENTQGGKVLPLNYLREYSELVQSRGLKRHLDGARAFNAAVALNVPIAEICEYFDSVSLCLSKGLGCPVGSLLVGDKAFIAQARRWRKMIGGGMRQAGIVAAAGLYALRNNVNLLAQDHEKAEEIGAIVESHPILALAEPVSTNMVMLAPDTIKGLATFLATQGIKISGPRLVFHQDIGSTALAQIAEALQQFTGPNG
ncbi:MAG: low-specificity L-threonine aldolase [Pseudomonadales bacterium]